MQSDDEGDEGAAEPAADDDEDDEWKEICNDDFADDQTDEQGRRFRKYMTYGGGPSGGYIVFQDGSMSTWHYDISDGYTETSLAPGMRLEVRRAPDGGNYFQLRIVDAADAAAEVSLFVS